MFIHLNVSVKILGMIMKTLMKTMIFAALALVMASCHFPDDYFDDNPGGGGTDYDINIDIQGNWGWLQSSGGIGGWTYYQKDYQIGRASCRERV